MYHKNLELICVNMKLSKNKSTLRKEEEKKEKRNKMFLRFYSFNFYYSFFLYVSNLQNSRLNLRRS